MKFNDDITLDIAKTVGDVLEGKIKKEEVKYPHKMYHPKTGAEVTVNDKAGHERYNKLGYTHTPKEVAQPEPKGEKDFKDKHVKKVSGMKNDGTNIKEDMAAMQYVFDSQQILTKFINLIKPIKDLDVRSQDKLPGGKRVITVHASKIALAKLHKVFTKLQKGDVSEEATPTAPAKEESEKQRKYQAFFNKALKKYGVKSPSELEGDKKKEFFDYVDANYEADDEPKESVQEATLKVSYFTGKVKNNKTAEKLGIKIKVHSPANPGNNVIFTGDEESLLKYARMYLGADKDDTLSDVQSQMESVQEGTQIDEILGVRIPDAGKDSSGIRKAVGKDDSKSGVTTSKMKDDDVIAKIQKRIEELEKLADKKAEQASDLRDKSEKAIDNGNDRQGDNLADQADRADDEYRDLQNKIEDEEERLKQEKEKFRKKRDS